MKKIWFVLGAKLYRNLFLSLAFGLLIFVYWFTPPIWRLLSGPIEVTRWTKKQGQIQAIVGPKEKNWADLEKISKHAIYAVIAAEDGKFYEHSGFDFESIKQAYEANKKKGRYVRGGSTISQQTVKMAFLGREKTLLRKAREALGTVLIETFLTKDQILEWYLNLAEFGDGIYGIHNGARHYFQTRPELLTIEQAVHLALVLPSPNSWSRSLRQKKLSDFAQRRFFSIINNMKMSGHISKTQWATTLRSGDFGRPLHGFESVLAADTKGEALCPGDPRCPEEQNHDVASEELLEEEIIADPIAPAVGRTDSSQDKTDATENKTPGDTQKQEPLSSESYPAPKSIESDQKTSDSSTEGNKELEEPATNGFFEKPKIEQPMETDNDASQAF